MLKANKYLIIQNYGVKCDAKQFGGKVSMLQRNLCPHIHGRKVNWGLQIHLNH
jgi:hypothetical protein